jgi:nucleoside-diphosphate-sugar epimerase
MTKKTAIVTGGAGLIGSHLVEHLILCGYKVRVVDDFSKGKLKHLESVKSQIEIFEGNLEDSSFSKIAFDGKWDYVFHLASRAYGIGYSSLHHLDVMFHNEIVTTNVLQALTTNPPNHVLITSSSCVHRDDGPDTTSELPLYDGEPEMANWGYGWAKRFLEQKFKIYSHITGVPLSIVRPFNIYGERYSWQGEFSQAIPMLVKKVKDDEGPIVVWGSGQQKRNYMHAKDCARLIYHVAEKKYVAGPVNIGTEKTISIEDLIALIKNRANSKSSVIFDKTKPEGRFVKSADATILRSIVGGEIIKIDLVQGIDLMLEWYDTNFPKDESQD